MNNDLERFIQFTESDIFNKDRRIESDLYPVTLGGYSLLEFCCYHGAVDCFKFLRTKFNSEITRKCLELSFLGGNPDIMSGCLKYQKPNKYCMENAIISHNIDFVTFMMNEYNIDIDLNHCGQYHNLESFFVCFDQTNDFNKCLFYSSIFDIPSVCEYFLSHGADINGKDEDGDTALYIAARYNCPETTEFLISHGININEAGDRALQTAASYNCKETAEVLISHDININKKDEYGKAPLHLAALSNCAETAEVLISHGANINKKDGSGETALHIVSWNNSPETAEVLISHGANINEKNKDGLTALQIAVQNRSKKAEKVLISYGAN
ncbi:ankyrin repeat protein, putative [Trichomonas vaginalis G3]|uniref:Ankyrin repeat protein, putative n=1 Tax=Trichomonas vaginalis (strain ATCC PRA-98 / G3) TaxID=412133 RepID=A2E8U4_TRIV3|nr:protein ubiquitination [Trichomonas vaginalis G3]EAY10926.1 ankyrin repeat protein, putative [Trichomonas vaginalis G3]KAI5485535.1 protein ubiquitination [Trichomonas vaginalis G3]|eukprot:XP_001323149.1 ankyrin repeat protein [Trichomonas vaginalis G3]